MSESASVASALLADLDSDEDVLIVNVMITTETEADPAPVEEFGLTMLDKIDRSFNHAGPEEAEIDVTQSESAAQVITDKSDDRGAAAMCDNESISNGSSAVTLGPEGDNGRGCKGPPAGCSQCETADCTSNCDTCGVLCEGCAVAHRRMKCLQAHKLNHLESENGKVIPTAHKSSCAEHDSNRQRWHWRWSESLPEPESRATEELEVLSHQKCPQLQPLSEPDQVPGLCTQWTIGCSSQVAGARNAESTNQLTRPRAVAVSQGLVYVCDAGADSKVVCPAQCRACKRVASVFECQQHSCTRRMSFALDFNVQAYLHSCPLSPS